MRPLVATLVGLSESIVALAGAVTTADLAPLSRTVRLHNRHGELMQTTVSNPTTGAWSMTTNGSALDRYEVVIMGDLDAGSEQSVIYNNL